MEGKWIKWSICTLIVWTIYIALSSYAIYTKTPMLLQDNNTTNKLFEICKEVIGQGSDSPDLVESDYTEDLLRRASFEQDFIKCSVQVIFKQEQLVEHLNLTNPDNRMCSRSLFIEYERENNRFFGEGTWKIRNKMYPDEIPGRFYPTGCNLDNTITDNINKLSKCFSRLNISKILITGDSNGNHYRQQLEDFLLSRSYNCTLDERGIQDNGSAPENWSTYFKVPNKPFYRRHAGCPNCRPQTHICTKLGVDKTEVAVEFVGLNQFVDRRVRFLEEPDISEFILDEVAFIELFLRDYLPHYGFPDLWFISPPTHHESWFQNLTSFRYNMTIFRQVLDHYLPTSTKVVFFSDVRECPMHRIDIVQLFYEKMNTNMERNEVFNAMNQIIFDTFRDRLLEENGNYYGFLDAGKILCPFTCNWHLDGGHMQDFVYQTFWEYVFQYLCTVD